MAEDDIKLESIEDSSNEMENELSLEDLGGQFVRNPKVGETMELTVKAIGSNKKDLERTNPKTQKKMKLALSNADYNIHVLTTSGKTWEVSNWEVWGKIQQIWKKLAGDNKAFTMNGQTLRVTHVLDGMRDENKAAGMECYSVAVMRDGKFYTLPYKKEGDWVSA